MQANRNNKDINMSTRIPLKHTQLKNKWVTVALVAVYAFVAIFIVLNA